MRFRIFHPGLALLLLLAASCGSTFIDEPGPMPDLDECFMLTRSLRGSTQKTPVRLPFSGARRFTLWTERPEFWDDFHGSVHLLDIEWNVTWIRHGSIQVGDFAAARLDHGAWTTFPRVSLKDALTAEGIWLRFDARLKGSGMKPRGHQKVAATATVAVCGRGAHLLAE